MQTHYNTDHAINNNDANNNKFWFVYEIAHLQLQLNAVTTLIEMFVIPVSVAHQAVSRCAQPLKACRTLLCCVVVVCCQQQQCCFNQHHVQLGLLSCSHRRSPFMSCLALRQACVCVFV